MWAKQTAEHSNLHFIFPKLLIQLFYNRAVVDNACRELLCYLGHLK